jgi:hypothetical protein
VSAKSVGWRITSARVDVISKPSRSRVGESNGKRQIRVPLGLVDDDLAESRHCGVSQHCPSSAAASLRRKDTAFRRRVAQDPTYAWGRRGLITQEGQDTLELGVVTISCPTRAVPASSRCPPRDRSASSLRFRLRPSPCVLRAAHRLDPCSDRSIASPGLPVSSYPLPRILDPRDSD